MGPLAIDAVTTATSSALAPFVAPAVLGTVAGSIAAGSMFAAAQRMAMGGGVL